MSAFRHAVRDPIAGRANRSYQTYRSYRSNRSYQTYQTYQTYRSYRSNCPRDCQKGSLRGAVFVVCENLALAEFAAIQRELIQNAPLGLAAIGFARA